MMNGASRIRGVNRSARRRSSVRRYPSCWRRAWREARAGGLHKQHLRPRGMATTDQRERVVLLFLSSTSLRSEQASRCRLVNVALANIRMYTSAFSSYSAATPGFGLLAG